MINDNEIKNDIPKINNTKLGVLAAIYVAMILIRDLTNVSIEFSIFSIVSVILSLCMNSSERVAFVILLLPFARGLPYHEMLLLNMGISIIFDMRRFRINAFHIILIALMLAIEVFNVILYSMPIMNIFYCGCYLLYMAYVTGGGFYKGNERKICLMFVVGTFLAVISVLLQTINAVGLDGIMSQNIRFGRSMSMKSSMTTFNPNELGFICIVSVTVSYFLARCEKRKFYYFLTVAVALLGFLSVSRAYMLGLAAFVVLCVFFGEKKNIPVMLGILILATILISLIASFNEDFYEWITEFLFERATTGQSDNLSGRISLFVNSWKNWLYSPLSFLFGFGTNYRWALFSLGIRMGTAHVGLQDVLLSWGLFGLVFLVIYLKMLHTAVSNNVKFTIEKNIPLIICVLFIQTLQFITQMNYLLILYVSILAVNIMNANVSESKNTKKIEV